MKNAPRTETEERIWSLLEPERGTSAHDRTDRIVEMEVYQKASQWFAVPDGVDPAEHWNNHKVIGKWFRLVDESSRVLDLGCGVGWPTLALAPFTREIVGIDASSEMIKLALKLQPALDTKRNAMFGICDASDMPFGNGVFDVCVSDNMIDVAANQSAILGEVHRVVKAGGTFALDFQSFKTSLGDKEIEETLQYENYGGVPVLIYRFHTSKPGYLEREYVLYLDPSSRLGRRVLQEPSEQAKELTVDLEEALRGTRVCRFWESVHHDNETMTHLLRETGFVDVRPYREGSMVCRKP